MFLKHRRAINFPSIDSKNTSKTFSDLFILLQSTFKNIFDDLNKIASMTSVTVSADYTVTLDDFIVLVDASSGNITITLPPVYAASSSIFVMKKIDSSANTVTIDGNASETIDGATTYVIINQYESKSVHSNGAIWSII